MNKTQEVVKEQLVKLGFFKYVNSENLQKTINNTFENYQNDGLIKFDYEDLNRVTYIDAEDIFEGNGLKDHAERICQFFKHLNVTLVIGDCIEEFDNEKYTTRTIELNNKIYSTPDVSDWATGFNSGFRLIDTLLLEYKIGDRLFGLFMDQSSTLIILDEELFQYLTELIPEDAPYRPIDIKAMIIEHYGY